MGTELPNPHDGFFRDAFSREEVGRDFLHNYLPPEIVRILDLKSAELTKDSFTDKELRMHFSDMIYKMRLKKGGGPAYVFIVLEHKSYPDWLVGFQLLRYMVRIWEQIVRKHQKEKKKKKAGKKGKRKTDGESPFLLPLVLPVLICHGRSAWNIPADFRSLLPECPEFASYIPDFRYVICDISSYSDDEIKGMVMLRVAMLVMKYIFRDDLAERLPEILGLMRDLVQKRSGLEFLETIMIYLSRGTDRLSEQELGESVRKAFSDEGGEIMPTLAEKWKNEGNLEGLLEGIELALDIKFGGEGLKILPEIRKIRDIDVLTAVHRGVKTKNTLKDLRRIYSSKVH